MDMKFHSTTHTTYWEATLPVSYTKGLENAMHHIHSLLEMHFKSFKNQRVSYPFNVVYSRASPWAWPQNHFITEHRPESSDLINLFPILFCVEMLNLLWKHESLLLPRKTVYISMYELKKKSQFLLHANYSTFWDLHKVACVFRGLQRLIEPILLSLNFKHTP